jgi:hypothetical protein
MTAEPEVLGAEVLESAPRWRPSRRAVGVVVALVVLAGCVAWYADHRTRTEESAAVSRCEQLLTHASGLADVRLGAVADMLRPAMATTEGVQQLHLADLMASPARQVLPRAQRAHRACQAVSLRPWHFSLVARRDAATAYSGALVTLLQTIAAQGRAYFRDDSTLQRLRSAAGVEGPG